MKHPEQTRTLMAAALVYAGGTHTVDDVVAMIERGEAQLWEGPRAVIVTEVVDFPRQKALHFFLAAGNRNELEAMQPGIIEWGVAQGCTKARLVGRKGWQRTFLARSGWHATQHIIMERDINGEGKRQDQLRGQQELADGHELRPNGSGCRDASQD